MNNNKTILNFKDQFEIFKKEHHSGYYNSADHLKDMFGPLMVDLKNKVVADIGSGPGRVIEMLLALGVKKITGIEPSDSIKYIKKNKRVNLIQDVGENLPGNFIFDYIFCLGVLHHVENPDKILKNALKTLKKNGKIFCWFYAYEGNEIYVKFVCLLRRITIILPDSFLLILSKIFAGILSIYSLLPKKIIFKAEYFKNVFSRYNFIQRTLIIFDQLNPQTAKYYKKEELFILFKKSGFKKIKFYKKSNYSWSVVASKS